MPNNQIRAEFATLDQLSADQAAHAGAIEGFRESLRQNVLQALNDLGGGVGTEEHQACMRQVDILIDAHIAATYGFQRSTGTVHETMMAGGNRARETLARGV